MRRAIVLAVSLCLCRLAHAETEAGGPDWFSQGANALTVPSNSPYYSSGADVTGAEAYTAPSAQPTQNAPPGPQLAQQGEASIGASPADAQLPAPAPVAPFARVIPNLPRPVEPNQAEDQAPAPNRAPPARTTSLTANVAPPPPPAPPPSPEEPVGRATLSGASAPSEENAESNQESLWVRVVALVLLSGLVVAVAVFAARPSEPRR